MNRRQRIRKPGLTGKYENTLGATSIVERTLLQERLLSIVSRFADRKILVIGDLIADQFIYGAIDRV